MQDKIVYNILLWSCPSTAPCIAEALIYAPSSFFCLSHDKFERQDTNNDMSKNIEMNTLPLYIRDQLSGHYDIPQTIQKDQPFHVVG